MTRRITITINQEIESKLRDIQAKKILESKKSISFSQVLNQILIEGLKHNSVD